MIMNTIRKDIAATRTISIAMHLSKSAPILLEWIGHILIFSVALTILFFLPRGIEFSDMGFYYVSIFNLHEIDMQTTQFSTVWKPFSFTDNILFHRVLTYFFLFVGAAFCIQSTFVYLNSNSQNFLLHICRILSFSSLSLIPYYSAWTPDPSYNSVGYTLCLVIFAIGFRIALKVSEEIYRINLELFFAGFLATPLFLARPFAPIIAALALSVFIFVSSRQTFLILRKVCLFGVLGIFSYILLQWIFVEPITTSIDRMYGGLLRRDLLNRGDIFSKGYEYAKEELFLLVVENLLLIGTVASIIFTASFVNILQTNIGKFLYNISIGLLFSLLILLIAVKFDTITPPPLLSTGLFITWKGSSLIYVGVITGIFARIFLLSVSRTSRARIMRENGVMVLGFTIVIATFFGTANGWLYNMDRYAGIFASLTIIPFLIEPSKGIRWCSSLMIFLCGAACVPYLSNMIKHPYRLPQNLLAQTERVSGVRGLENIRVDQSTRSFLLDLSSAAAETEKLDVRPALIDLTGRLPFSAFFLDFSTPKSAWVLSGYTGSQLLFNHTYNNVDQGTLDTAWILEGPNWPLSFDLTQIDSYSLAFPEDYDLVVEGWSDYIQSEVKLWAPRNRKLSQSHYDN